MGKAWYSCVLLGFFIAAPTAGLLAQSSQTAPPYVLRTETREVLTDVVVTDRTGKPVQDLSASAFHIYDDGHEQKLTSFTEHNTRDANLNLAAAPSDGSFDNAFLQHAPAVLNVLLLDLTTMAIEDQMSLYGQMKRLVDRLPPDRPMAIFARMGPSVVEAQSFTSDHALLNSALRKVIPRFRPPGSSYLTDADALRQMALLLSQYPGRKNLFWFSGGSNLFLGPAPEAAAVGDLRPIYDELETERIALYPVDIRGLTNEWGQNVGTGIEAASMTINAAQLRAAPDAKLPFDQLIYLPKGDIYLYLAVWDTTTGRPGMVDLPVTVRK
jgi:VWFA-related protein